MGTATDGNIAVKKINENARLSSGRGKQVQNGRKVVSDDGKRMTRTVKGTTAEGHEYLESLVYDKQWDLSQVKQQIKSCQRRQRFSAVPTHIWCHIRITEQGS